MQVQATKPHARLEVTTDASGIVSHAGSALLGEVADRLQFTSTLDRWAGARAGRCRYRDVIVLRDLAVMLADGGDCLSDLATLRDQPELFGPVASLPTAWRVVERTATDPDGLARLRWRGRTRAAGPGAPARALSGGRQANPRPARPRRGALSCSRFLRPPSGLASPSHEAQQRDAARRRRRATMACPARTVARIAVALLEVEADSMPGPPQPHEPRKSRISHQSL